MTDKIKCHGCGALTPAHLIDAKPFAGATTEQIKEAADNGRDFLRLECRECYGSGWAPLHA